MNTDQTDRPDCLFSFTDDYINLSEVARDYPSINELELRDQDHFLENLKAINEERQSIPIFIKGYMMASCTFYQVIVRT